VVLWFPAVGHPAVDFVFTPYASRHRVSVPWFLSHPMPLGIRDSGVCTLLRERFYGSWRVMGYQGGSRLLGIRFCQPHAFP